MKYKQLIKVYFLHFKTYLLLWLLIGLAIAIPLSLDTYVDGLLNICLNDYTLNNILSADMLIESSANNNRYNVSAISAVIERDVMTAINSLSFADRISVEKYSYLENRDGSLYIYEVLGEQGYAEKILVSDNVPEGYFSYDSHNREVEDVLYFVSSKFGQVKELKKLNEPIAYPLSYMIPYAINRKDAADIFLSSALTYITLDTSLLTGAEVDELLLKLRENKEIVCYQIDEEQNVLLGSLFSSLGIYYRINWDLRVTTSILSKSFFLLSLCSLVVVCIQIYSVRSNEYRSLKRLGLSGSSFLCLRLVESILSAINGGLTAVCVMLIAKAGLYFIPASEKAITDYNNSGDFLVLYSDVFARNGRYVFEIPFIDLLESAVSYFVILIIVEIAVALTNRRRML